MPLKSYISHILYLGPFKQSVVIDILKYILVLFLLCWLTLRGNERLGYNWQWFQIPHFFYSFEDGQFTSGPLLRGLLTTVKITVISLLFAVIAGLVSALLRLSKSFSGKILAFLYIEIIRNTPLLIQLFFIYFVISPILDINRFASAVITLSLFEGAYISEIFRSGILSIDKGQWEAAGSLGMKPVHIYSKIILPQAVRRTLPPLTGQAISLIKDSALVSTIAIYDLTMEGRVIISETYLTFEIWFTIALIYLMLTVTISLFVKNIEKRLKFKY